jgi:hypothetical protein
VAETLQLSGLDLTRLSFYFQGEMTLPVDAKLQSVMIAALEVNIQLNQSLLAEEANEDRRKYLKELLTRLIERLKQEKTDA